MDRKPTDPLSGCFFLTAGSFVLLMTILLLVKQFSPEHAARLSSRFAAVFVGIIFWVAVITLLSGSRRN
ncbi:MAG TPA: hypothetical protein VGN63_04185 [Flavisolibacter sp.]|jgi:glycerol uptake facilitator-like aquaporin|nr:hypothetical protein [Flavisolibacter sp.]